MARAPDAYEGMHGTQQYRHTLEDVADWVRSHPPLARVTNAQVRKYGRSRGLDAEGRDLFKGDETVAGVVYRLKRFTCVLCDQLQKIDDQYWGTQSHVRDVRDGHVERNRRYFAWMVMRREDVFCAPCVHVIWFQQGRRGLDYDGAVAWVVSRNVKEMADAYARLARDTPARSGRPAKRGDQRVAGEGAGDHRPQHHREPQD